MNDQAQVGTVEHVEAEAVISTGFDIDLLDSAEVTFTHRVGVLQDADGNDVSGFILVGKNSDEYQKTTKQIRVANIKKAAARKTQLDASSDIGAAVIAKTVDEGDRAIALAVVTGWFGFTSGGKPITFDKGTVAKMFAKFPTWQNKVLAALEEESNFMKAL